MELMATATATAPVVRTWYYFACAGALLLCTFNVWRFQTGWRMTGEHYRRRRIQFLIGMGFASIPQLVAMLGMTLSLVLLPQVERTRNGWLAYAFLLGAALLVVGALSSAKEYSRPSRWNRPPRWLKEARERGEI